MKYKIYAIVKYGFTVNGENCSGKICMYTTNNRKKAFKFLKKILLKKCYASRATYYTIEKEN